MLNPSTADGYADDPTVRRCMGFARRLGHGGIVVVNLYAYRATDPSELWLAADPVGPDNDRHILDAVDAGSVGNVIAAWGAHAKPARAEVVRRVLDGARVTCLGRTRSGAPRHPLLLPYDTAMEPWP